MIDWLIWSKAKRSWTTASSEARKSRIEEILSKGRVCLAKVWADRLKWGSERTVSKDIFCWAIVRFTGDKERSIILLHSTMPVLYPAIHAGCYLPVRHSHQITNLVHCHIAGGGWCKSIPNRCIHSGVLGHIGWGFYNRHWTTLGRFQMEAVINFHNKVNTSV